MYESIYDTAYTNNTKVNLDEIGVFSLIHVLVIRLVFLHMKVAGTRTNQVRKIPNKRVVSARYLYFHEPRPELFW